LRCLSGRRGAYGDDVRVETQAFGGEGGKTFATPVSGKVVDVDGLSVHIAQIAQGREERFKSRRPQCPGIKRKEAEPRDILGLLSLRRKRPCCRTADERDEFASFHLDQRTYLMSVATAVECHNRTMLRSTFRRARELANHHCCAR